MTFAPEANILAVQFLLTQPNTVTLYRRGADGQPVGAGLRLDLDANGRLTGPRDTPFAGLSFGTLDTADMLGGVRLPPGFGAALAGVTPGGVDEPIGGEPGSGAGLQTGYSFELRTQEEADLVAALRAQGKGAQEIQSALDDLRGTRGGAADPGFPLTVAGQVLPTPRDGVIGGVPTGEPADATQGDPENRRGLRRENEAAVTLAAAGYRVEQNPSRQPGDTYGPTKRPDLRIGENIFDVYSPMTSSIENMRDMISKKVKDQASRIVINLADSTANLDQLRNVIARKSVSGLLKLLVINQQGQIVRLFPNVIADR